MFKTGFLVTDLEGAMRDFGRWLGVSWTPVQQSKLVLAVGADREEVELRFAYSTGSPPYLELLEAQPRGYYAAKQGAHLHHVGRWVDDLGRVPLSAWPSRIENTGRHRTTSTARLTSA